MIEVKQTYKVGLNKQTRDQLVECIERLTAGIVINAPATQQELMNYIAKLAKTCFDKGLAEGRKE